MFALAFWLCALLASSAFPIGPSDQISRDHRLFKRNVGSLTVNGRTYRLTKQLRKNDESAVFLGHLEGNTDQVIIRMFTTSQVSEKDFNVQVNALKSFNHLKDVDAGSKIIVYLHEPNMTENDYALLWKVFAGPPLKFPLAPESEEAVQKLFKDFETRGLRTAEIRQKWLEERNKAQEIAGHVVITIGPAKEPKPPKFLKFLNLG